MMERVDGTSLRALMRGGRLPYDVVRRIVMDVAEALEYVHDRGILHRDISPANILISRHGEVKLADFGLARLQAESGTTPGFKGTAAYASPEAIQGRALEPSADLYGLAAVVYELIVGMPPYGHADPDEIARRQDPASSWVIEPLPEDVPEDLHALVMDLLAPVEQRKLRSADHVLALLGLGAGDLASNRTLGALVESCLEDATTRERARSGERVRSRERGNPSRRRPFTIFSLLILLGVLSTSWSGRDAAPAPDRGARARLPERSMREMPAVIAPARPTVVVPARRGTPDEASVIQAVPAPARAAEPAAVPEPEATMEEDRRSKETARPARSRAGRARAVGTRRTSASGAGRGLRKGQGFQL